MLHAHYKVKFHNDEQQARNFDRRKIDTHKIFFVFLNIAL